MKLSLFVTAMFMLVLVGCSSQDEKPVQKEVVNAKSDSVVSIVKEILPVKPLFEEIDTNYTSHDFLLPEGYQYQILFQEKYDQVTRVDGAKFNALGKHDMCQYIPIDGSSSHGYLYVSHEYRYANKDLGDGGQGTVFEVKKDSSGWKVVSDFDHIDFSSVGFTHRNCGGTLTPHGTILTAEETYPTSNKNIYYGGKYITDLTPINGRETWTNFGYMVEVDPISKKPIQKLYSMGRFMHEDAECMPDGKTVFLSDDYPVAVLFKFEADVKGDYSQGQLFAYKQSEDLESGEWLAMPRDTNSLIKIRDVAVEKGATLFQRHEWMFSHDDKLYIAETGNKDFDWNKRINQGGVPAKHLDQFLVGDNKYVDIHGRILELDLKTNKLRVYLECGQGVSDSLKVISNPDCISLGEINGADYLVISEDIDWYDAGRVPDYIEKTKQFVNEIYFVPLNLENPTVDDALRFGVGPRGSETTGSCFTPDGSTMFINVQHPNVRNSKPFDRSCTVAITGFND